MLGSADVDQKVSDTSDPAMDRDKIDGILEAAGMAPFHHPSASHHHTMHQSPVPWRVYKLDQSSCLSLMKRLVASGDVTKVPNMLSAAQYLLQVTWLPDEANEASTQGGALFIGTIRNMEHIAAASAMVQSLLLAATDAGMKTYWSSGGPLRSSEAFDYIGISRKELLLGAIFLFPAESKNAEEKPGKMRELRGELSDWSLWCDSPA